MRASLALLAICLLASETERAAGAGHGLTARDPGGRESAIVKVPAAGNRFLGIHEPTIVGPSKHGWSPTEIGEVAAGAGMETVRFTINWSEVEPLRDVWDNPAWGRFDAAYRGLIRNGIRPFIGISNAPPWARDFGLPMLCSKVRGCEYAPRAAMLGEWAEFAREVARRYPRAVAIEIWNEPNHSAFYKPEPQPERYAALVARAYDAIKAVNPKIKVIGGALAAADRTNRDPLQFKTVLSMEEFLTRAYKAEPSLAGHMDGISFHQAGQSIRFGKNSQLALAFKAARKMRRQYDSKRIPIWITEFGLSTTDGPRVTPSVQADAMMRAYRKIMTMKDVKALVFHTLGDRIELPRSDGEHGVGMIESYAPFIPKPAFCEFAGRLRAGPPFGGCKRIREWRLSRCTRSLASLRRKVANADSPAARKTFRKRLARRWAACVPCTRKEAVLKRAIRRGGPSRAALRALKRRCSPCEQRLSTLQRRYVRAIPTLRLDFLNKHETVRRRCR